MEVGDRVNVKGLTGKVRYIGEVKFSGGKWFGIELDEPLGKNDGSVQGIRYFTPEKVNGLYGLFCRNESIKHAEIDKTLVSSQNPIISSDNNLRLKKVVDKLQSKLYLLHTECMDLRKQLTEKNNKLEEITILKEKIDTDIILKDKLRKEVNSLNNQLHELQERYEKNILQLNEYKEEIELRRSIELEEIDKDDLQPDIVWRRNKLLSVALIKLQNTLDISTQLSNNLKDDNDKTKIINENLKKETLNLRLELEEVRQSIDDMNIELDSEGLRELVDSLTTKNVQLNDELDELKARFKVVIDSKKIDDELHNIYRAMEQELNNQIRDLQDKINENQGEISRLKLKNINLAKELQKQVSSNRIIFQNEKNEDLNNKLEILQLEKYNLSTSNELLSLRLEAATLSFPLDYSIQMNFLEEKIHNLIFQTQNLSHILCQFSLIFLVNVISVLKDNVEYQNNITPRLKEILANFYHISEWTNAVLDKQIPVIDNFVSLKNIYQNFPALKQDLTLFHSILLKVCIVPIPHTLAILKSLNPDKLDEIKVLYGLFQNLEKISNSFLTKNSDNKFYYKSKNVDLMELLLVFYNDAIKNLVENVRFSDISKNMIDFNKVINSLEAENVMYLEKVNQESNKPNDNYSKELVNYKEKIVEYENIICEKSTLIDELFLKIKVLDVKVEKRNTLEDAIIELREQLIQFETSNIELNKKISELEFQKNELKETLDAEFFKKNNLIIGSHYIETVKERENAQKSELLSEINELRNVIRLREKHSDIEDYSWLVETEDKSFTSDTIFFNKMNNLCHTIHTTIKEATLIPIQAPSVKMQWKPKNSISKYYSALLFEREIIIQKLIKDVIE